MKLVIENILRQYKLGFVQEFDQIKIKMFEGSNVTLDTF